MLESMILHFVFVLFAVWAFVWWLASKKKFDSLRNALLPIILLKKIELPQNRSLVVRAGYYLQEDLSNLFQCKIQIEYKFVSLTASCYENFLLPLCLLMVKDQNSLDKNFVLDKNLYSAAELVNYAKLKTRKNRIIFVYDFLKNIWNVEIQDAK